MRKVGIVVSLIVLLLVLFPYAVFAGSTSYVRVEALGTDNLVLPGPPTLTATLASNTEVDLSWIMGAGATGTLIRAKYGVAPTSPADGYAVYTGNSTVAIDWITNIELSDNTLWYSAWSYNGVGYSLTYDTASVAGGTMASAITMLAVVGFMGIGLGANIFGYWQKKWWFCPIAFFLWVAIAYECYTQSAASAGSTTFDFYRFLIWVCIGFALVSVGEMWYVYRNGQVGEEPEDDMATRNRKRQEANLARTFNRKPSPQATVKRRPPPSTSVGDGL